MTQTKLGYGGDSDFSVSSITWFLLIKKKKIDTSRYKQTDTEIDRQAERQRSRDIDRAAARQTETEKQT